MKIAVLGAAPSSCELAPFHDMSWEIWACSPSNFRAKRVDAWFEMHSLDRKWVPGNEPYIEVINRHARVYTAQPDGRLPHGIVYPVEEVFKFFGGDWNDPLDYLRTFFQSQVSFMLAYAIMQQPEEIGLWGVDMAAKDEYSHQRPGCHFFMREAKLRGIKVYVAPQSDLMMPLPLYGYKEFTHIYWKQKARLKELQARHAEAVAKKEEYERTQLILQGAIEDIGYVNQTWIQP